MRPGIVPALTEFFRRNPDEELTVEDIQAKFPHLTKRSIDHAICMLIASCVVTRTLVIRARRPR